MSVVRGVVIEIPQGEFLVQTEDALYRIGPGEPECYRVIERNGLKFETGKGLILGAGANSATMGGILSDPNILVTGKSMVLAMEGRKPNQFVYTTRISSVQPLGKC